MSGKSRFASLEKDLRLAEAAYEERLTRALYRCVVGQWGLFGGNDASAIAHFGAKSSLLSRDAFELLERGKDIAALRERLGYVDQFPLAERFSAYRRMALDHNAPGEPKLAQRLLDEIDGDSAGDPWKKLYREFDEWLVTRFDEWDPQGLLSEANPGCEYGPEVSRIMPLLRTVETTDQLAAEIHKIFIQMFDEQSAGTSELYEPIARAILEEWNRRSETLARTESEDSR